ncbi:MAG: hypothetical protein LC624_04195 [Halobacteriales archaeon]|nr:hypothetical protein [Halobacteriales archaeon]
MTEEYKLTVGSKYLIRSVLTREQVLETECVFKGITTLGTSDAFVVEVGGHDKHKGKLRCIPTHMITSVDILERAETKEQAKKVRADEENVHYG